MPRSAPPCAAWTCASQPAAAAAAADRAAPPGAASRPGAPPPPLGVVPNCVARPEEEGAAATRGEGAAAAAAAAAAVLLEARRCSTERRRSPPPLPLVAWRPPARRGMGAPGPHLPDRLEAAAVGEALPPEPKILLLLSFQDGELRIMLPPAVFAPAPAAAATSAASALLTVALDAPGTPRTAACAATPLHSRTSSCRAGWRCVCGGSGTSDAACPASHPSSILLSPHTHTWMRRQRDTTYGKSWRTTCGDVATS